MKIILAPDSFKESMDAVTAADAMAQGVSDVADVLPDTTVVRMPLADGGEGTVRTLTATLGGDLVDVDCTDALGRPHRGVIGLVRTPDGHLTAVVEAAESNGLGLIDPSERDPLTATTTGVADLVTAALDAGADTVIVGLGGSATTDGGAGLLTGLGARLLDADGRLLEPLPRDLPAVARVDLDGLDERLASTRIIVASDVSSPLTGPDGAAEVFGPQKGASPDQVRFLDDALASFADRVGGDRTTPGAGAAGGLGFALLTLGAEMRPGIDIVTGAVGLREALADADLVLTAEGRVDGQTSTGKVPAGVAALATEARDGAGVPVVVLAGSITDDADTLLDYGVTALVPILPGPVSLDEALRDGPANLRRATATTLRLLTGFVSPGASPTSR